MILRQDKHLLEVSPQLKRFRFLVNESILGRQKSFIPVLNMA